MQAQPPPAVDTHTHRFILDNLDADVHQLALRSAPADVDLGFALQQIEGRQKARTKLPTLASHSDLLFPPSLGLEQCSSEATALYKQRVVASLLTDDHKPRLMADLTGGFGIDFIHLAPLFERAIYVERQTALCEIATHNFQALGLNHATVLCESAEDALPRIAGLRPTLLYLDPARRDSQGSRTYAITDCTPNATALLPQLLEATPYVLLKLSPMLDWHRAVAELTSAGGRVAQVHIVESASECKELLILVSRPSFTDDAISIVCRTDTTIFRYTTADIPTEPAPLLPSARLENPQGLHLCVPSPALMKAGCWSLLTKRFQLVQADTNSHLFFSEQIPTDFPGRVYAVRAITTMNKRALRTTLNGVTQANISVRNFPLSAEQLRVRLKLRDGGDTYIFATTIAGRHLLLITERCVQSFSYSL